MHHSYRTLLKLQVCRIQSPYMQVMDGWLLVPSKQLYILSTKVFISLTLIVIELSYELQAICALVNINNFLPRVHCYTYDKYNVTGTIASTAFTIFISMSFHKSCTILMSLNHSTLF